MCNPAFFYAAMAVSAAGSAVSAYGQQQQGEYRNKIAQNNAVVQERMAEAAIARGARREQTHREKVAQYKSQQRAAFGAAGRDVNTGSASDILADTARMGEYDALTLRHNAELEAYAQEVSASNSLLQGNLDALAGTYGATGTLLAGAGNLGSNWATFKKA